MSHVLCYDYKMSIIIIYSGIIAVARSIVRRSSEEHER